MKITINSLLTMERNLKSRLSQLNELRNSTSTRETYFEKDKVIEPLYDVKLVDKKMTKITKALYFINNAVKESNAKTKVDIDINYDDLVSEIE